MELFTERGQLDVYDDFTWSLNYITAEVVNLTGRKASYSKTIKIPYTRRNRAIFEGLNELNVSNVGYNTKSSLRAFVTHNNRVLLSGALIVLQFDELKEEQTIQLQMVANVKLLMTKLKSINLNELDFSRYEHPYTRDDIFNNIVYGSVYLDDVPQVLPQGKGYTYALIDYGKDDSNGETRWNVQDLRPCLYLKEYIDTAFRLAGMTYNSQFLDSPWFGSLTLENTISQVQLTDVQREEFATEIINQSGFKSFGDLGGIGQDGWPIIGGNFLNDWYENLTFDLEVNDPLNQWDITTTNVFTAPRKGEYRFNLLATFSHEFCLITQSSIPTPQSSAEWYNLSNGQVVNYNPMQIIESHYLQVYINNVLYDESDYQALNPANYSLTGISNPNGLHNLNWQSLSSEIMNEEFVLDLNEGDNVTFKTFDQKRSTAPNIPTPFIRSIQHRFNFQSIRVTTEINESFIEEGDTLNFLNYIPNIKASTFIDGVFNFFNLWVLDDPNDENNLIIEPRTNIFGGKGYLRMSEKVDRSKIRSSDYLADSLPRRYRYQFRVSDDVLNTNYNELNDLPYADYDSIVDVDFSTDDSAIPTIFSPLISQLKNGLVYPIEYAFDNVSKTGIGSFLKIGFTSRESGNWELEGQAGVVNMDQYVRISEFDEISKPNYALTFGDANTQLPLSTIPYWNVYRLFHKLTEEEQTRDGSKIVTMYFNLNENDISLLDLTRVWEVDGVYFRIISIDSFNPISNKSTKVRLLQVDSPDFDYTSNEMIFNLKGIPFVLGGDGSKLLTTNKNQYVQPY